MVVGTAAIDVITQFKPPTTITTTTTTSDTDTGTETRPTSILTKTTHPSRITLSPGGVARNIATAIHRLLPHGRRDEVLLVSPVGRDRFGEILEREMGAGGMRVDGLIRGGKVTTGTVALVLDDGGDLVVGGADMESTEDLGFAEVRGRFLFRSFGS